MLAYIDGVVMVAGVVGERIKELRLRRGLTQDGLASRIGVSRQTISNWEVGQTTVSTAYLASIAEALKVDETDLVARPAQRDTGTRFNLRADDREATAESQRSGGAHGSAGARSRSSGFATEDRNVSGRVEDLRSAEAQRLPIYRWGSLGDPRDQFSAPYPDRLDYPPLGREQLVGPNGFGVEVRGVSMVGRDLRDGDVCWINPDRGYRVGDLVLALVSDHEDDAGMVIKTFARTEVGDCLLSETDTGKSTVVCQSFRIIGPVVWIERGFPPR